MNIASFLTSNRLVYVLIGGIAFVVFITLILLLARFGGGGAGSEKAELEFWGVFDDITVFDDVIKNFEELNPNITITFRNFAFPDYEQAFVNALAAGGGPDVLMLHNTWLPRHFDKLVPAPRQLPGEEEVFFPVSRFEREFVDVALRDLTSGDQVFAMPLYVDTLALYYNKDLFGTAGIALPPRTWSEFNAIVPKLVRKDENFNIVQAAIPMGTARNVNRSTDILMMLMLQNGTQMVDDDGRTATFAKSVDGQPVGENALQYYTDFAMPTKQVYTWNDAQNYSIDAFAAGQAAMMINYSHQIPLIRAKNPRLNFQIAPIPQHDVGDARTFASYFAVGVTRNSESSNAAWRFVRYLTSPDGSIAYLNAALRPTARRDLIDQQRHDPEYGVFAEQALTARSWYQVDNAAIETIFADTIDDVILGRQTVRKALSEAESKVTVLMGER